MGNKPQLPSASVCNTASSRKRGMKESWKKHNVHAYTRKKRKLLTTPRKTRGSKDIRDSEIVSTLKK
jgi:hypothetical protein